MTHLGPVHHLALLLPAHRPGLHAEESLDGALVELTALALVLPPPSVLVGALHVPKAPGEVVEARTLRKMGTARGQLVVEKVRS